MLGSHPPMQALAALLHAGHAESGGGGGGGGEEARYAAQAHWRVAKHLYRKGDREGFRRLADVAAATAAQL